MCAVEFDYKSKLLRHLRTDKHIALAGVIDVTDTQGDDSPPMTSDPVLESALDVDPEVYL